MDPIAYLWYVYMMQSQQSLHQVTSIFDTITFWIIIAAVGGVLVRFVLAVAAFKAIQKSLTGGSEYQSGPLGPLGPIFGVPANVRKSQSAIEADRSHSYRKWGTILSFLCILGGIFLFTIGVTGNSDVEIASVVAIKNAAPGTILFVLGFLVWRGLQKEKHVG